MPRKRRFHGFFASAKVIQSGQDASLRIPEAHGSPSLQQIGCNNCHRRTSTRWFNSLQYGRECNFCYRNFQRRGLRRSASTRPRKEKRDSEILIANLHRADLGTESPLSQDASWNSEKQSNEQLSTFNTQFHSDEFVQQISSGGTDSIYPQQRLLDVFTTNSYSHDSPISSSHAPTTPKTLPSSPFLDIRSPTVSPITPPRSLPPSPYLQPAQPPHGTTMKDKSGLIKLKLNLKALPNPEIIATQADQLKDAHNQKNLVSSDNSRLMKRTSIQQGDHTKGPTEQSMPSSDTPSAQSHRHHHGLSTRAYLNGRVTPSLLAGVKWLAWNEPARPLEWLGGYLLEMSAQLERGEAEAGHVACGDVCEMQG